MPKKSKLVSLSPVDKKLSSKDKKHYHVYEDNTEIAIGVIEKRGNQYIPLTRRQYLASAIELPAEPSLNKAKNAITQFYITVQ